MRVAFLLESVGYENEKSRYQNLGLFAKPKNPRLGISF